MDIFHNVALVDKYLIKNKEKIKELGQNGYQFVKKNITKENYGGKIYQILNMVKNQQLISKKYQLLIKSFTLAYQNKLTTLTPPKILNLINNFPKKIKKLNIIKTELKN